MNLAGKTIPELADLATDPSLTAEDFGELEVLFKRYAPYFLQSKSRMVRHHAPFLQEADPHIVRFAANLLRNPSIPEKAYGNVLVATYHAVAKKRPDRMLVVLAAAAENPILPLELLGGLGPNPYLYYLLLVMRWLLVAQPAIHDSQSLAYEPFLRSLAAKLDVAETNPLVRDTDSRLVYLQGGLDSATTNAAKRYVSRDQDWSDRIAMESALAILWLEGYLDAIARRFPRAKLVRTPAMIRQYAEMLRAAKAPTAPP